MIHLNKSQNVRCSDFWKAMKMSTLFRICNPQKKKNDFISCPGFVPYLENCSTEQLEQIGQWLPTKYATKTCFDPFISIALWNDSNGILKIWNLYNIITCAEQYRNLSFDNLHFTKPNQTLQCNLAHSHHWIEIEYFLFQSIPVICVSIIWCGAPDVVQKNTRTEKYLSLKILRRLPKKIDETDKNRRFGVWMCVWVH